MMPGQILSINAGERGWPILRGMKIDLIALGHALRSTPEPDSFRVALSVAGEQDREAVYRLRHEVYAHELRQHETNPSGRLQDRLDDGNVYLVAKIAGQIAGLIR